MEEFVYSKAKPACLMVIVAVALVLAVSFIAKYVKRRQGAEVEIQHVSDVVDTLKQSQEAPVENIKINSKRLRKTINTGMSG